MLGHMKFKLIAVVFFFFALVFLLDGYISIAFLLVLIGIGMWAWGNARLKVAREEGAIKKDARRQAKYDKVFNKEYYKERRK
ncbi:hypothetical protein [Bacillus nitratireducens]|uniref:hypothetical protein n=1 Tax=Bacillus nitratireducens TaxID=2026193 RepID=UPI000A27D34D|nr:hypothetical protein [Bacillus nitratireducens]OSY01000.1 hypothetical protein BTJ45_00062 [Bacillus mycoides]PFJ81868.1 hypothetical protein COI95_06140 [Bacillus cereus]PFK00806.1 hypothetical protein COI97_17220 [Bacillus cereus]PGM80034.1 hypothetical protein CN957_15380 [Bacillus cereus]